MRPEHTIAPNVPERDFTAPGPNQKWVADFTYIWAGEGWLFLAVWSISIVAAWSAGRAQAGFAGTTLPYAQFGMLALPTRGDKRWNEDSGTIVRSRYGKS